MATEPTTHSTPMGNEELAVIKGDLQQLKADLAELLATTKSRGQAKAENLGQDAIHTLHEAIDTLSQRVRAAKENVSDKTRASVEQAEQVIEHYPVVSLLTAFGIGLVVARLFSKN